MILDDDDGTDTPERCQSPYCAHETTCGVASKSSIAWERYSQYTMAPFQPLQARSSPLASPHHL